MTSTNITVRIRFSKLKALRFIGHLDFLRVFQQMIRRAELPVAYSQGFNPHILLSFALPLPLGMESVNDYVDLSLETEMPHEEMMDRLNKSAPDGLIVTGVKLAEGRAAAIAAIADYSFDEDIAQEILDKTLNATEIIVPKKTKSGIKNADIRPDILNLSKDGEKTIFRLSAGSARFLNPLIVAEYLMGSPQSASKLARLELYKATDDGIIPL